MFDYDAERRKVDGLLARRLFFTVGAMKSGSTWLQLLLDGHPAISCRGEGHFVDYLSPILQKAVNDYNKNIAAKNKTIFTEIEGYPLLGRDQLGYLIASAIALLMAEQSADDHVEVVGEATPGNVRDMPMLHELFPEARFVHIIRDGRDAGSFKRLARGRRQGEEHRGSHFRKGIVGDWRNHLDADALRGFDERAGPLLSELGYA